MKNELLELLCCLKAGQRLPIEIITGNSLEIDLRWLISQDERSRYSISNSIMRFIPESNCANNFVKQWNLFFQTRLDSYSVLSISTDDRFWLVSIYDHPQTTATLEPWLEQVNFIDVEIGGWGHLGERANKFAEASSLGRD